MMGVLIACVLLSGGLVFAQAPDKNAGMGIGLAIGVNKYVLADDLKLCSEDAQTIGKALELGGYRIVTVLADGAKDWELRPTMANVRSQISQLARLARPQDSLVVFFSGHVGAADGKINLVPSDGAEDCGVPLEWVCATLAASKAGGKLLILDCDKGVNGVAETLDRAKGANKLAMLLSCKPGETSALDAKSGRHAFVQCLLDALGGKADKDGNKWLTQAEISDYVTQGMQTGGRNQSVQLLGSSPDMLSVVQVIDLGGLKRAPSRSGNARIRFVMHRHMAMLDISGTSREVWTFNDQTIDINYSFKYDTNEIIYVAELPPGDYTVTQIKWEHKTNYGIYSSAGPFDPMPMKLRVLPGTEHELKEFNLQEGMSPYGTGMDYWDNKRICYAHSLTRKVLYGGAIDQEIVKGPLGAPIRGQLIGANGLRNAKLFAPALKQYKDALQKASEVGNRLLLGEVEREMAWQYATAKDDAFRSGKKALALAQSALELGMMSDAEDLWAYKDALGAALAESGNFADAAKKVTEAMGDAKNAKPVPAPPMVMTALEARLKLYQGKQPYRD
jgi:hypothetical protein